MRFSDFGFEENPFSITPDPRYLFLSRGHEESLAHLIYGTGPNGGFVQLTGEVGTGKTLLVRSLLEQKLEDVDIALILNPRLSSIDFLATICDELNITYDPARAGLKELTDRLSDHLVKTHEQGRNTVLVVDEAQNLTPDVLEQVRLLTNLETTKYKLMRIILVGQPELQTLLARRDMRQVDQRITARYHLSPLTMGETQKYIRHRLSIAGIRGDLFTRSAMHWIHRLTGGIPRLINTLCERALLAVYATDSQRVNARLVWRVNREIRGNTKSGYNGWAFTGLAVIVLAAAVWWWLPQDIWRASWALVPTQPEPAKSPEHQPQIPVNVPVTMLEDQPADEPASAEQTQVDTSAPEPAQIAIDQPPETVSEDSEVVVQVKPVPEEIAPGPVAESAPEKPSPISEPQNLYQQLFALWQIKVAAGVESDPCLQAQLLGLRCLIDNLTWNDLARLNRPALLNLNGDGGLRTVLLKARDAGGAMIVDQGQEQQITIEELTSRWNGQSLLLWRPPTDAALIGKGSVGNAVVWLREQLAHVDGVTATVSGANRFDDELQGRLKRFQRSVGLVADGIAGPRTMIALNSLQSVAGTPTLNAGD